MASPPRRLALDTRLLRLEPAVRTAMIAVLVSLGYYVGTEIGLRARFPQGGERVQLQQVILNLFMNAHEAMSGAADGPRELVVRTQHGPAGVEFLVSDTGPGLSDEARARMFEPFFTTKPQGLGLGLSISRTIVRDHGGEIRVVRHADRGSTMAVTLPR